MRLLKYLIVLVFIMPIYSCTKIKKEYYKDGNLQSEVRMKNGKKNGKAIYYHENGMKSMELYYIDDMAEGISTIYYYKGTVKRNDNFKKNKLNGVSVNWDENLGYRFSEETYVEDVLNGTYKEFHPNGEVKVQGNYKNGLFDSKWLYFDERGVPVGEAIFDKGNGILKGYYPNGKPLREVNYVNNKKNGKETHWDITGKVDKIIYYKDDKIEKIETQ